MPWLRIDDAFWAHPKVMAAGNEVAGAYVRLLSYCAQQLTDGVVTSDVAKVIATPALQRKLISFGFVERHDEGLVIPDYLDFNPSRAHTEEIRIKRAKAGRRGGKVSNNGGSNE